MSEALNPSASTLVKLGSIARHAEEMLSPEAHHFDAAAIRSLLSDPEVVAWMEAADKLALLPLLRGATSSVAGSSADRKETEHGI